LLVLVIGGGNQSEKRGVEGVKQEVLSLTGAKKVFTKADEFWKENRTRFPVSDSAQQPSSSPPLSSASASASKGKGQQPSQKRKRN